MGTTAAGIIGGFEGALSLGEGIFGAVGSHKAEKARLNALKLRMNQIQDQTRQQSIDQMQRLNHTLASQAAVQAARGGGTSGLVSGNILAMSSINQFAQDENADNLNEVFQKESVVSQMLSSERGAQSNEMQYVMGGLIQAGSDVANAYLPSQSSSKTIDTNSPYASEGADDMQQVNPGSAIEGPDNIPNTVI